MLFDCSRIKPLPLLLISVVTVLPATFATVTFGSGRSPHCHRCQSRSYGFGCRIGGGHDAFQQRGVGAEGRDAVGGGAIDIVEMTISVVPLRMKELTSTVTLEFCGGLPALLLERGDGGLGLLDLGVCGIEAALEVDQLLLRAQILHLGR